MKLLHFGKVKDGKLSLNNQIQFSREIKAFEGKEVVITLEKKSKKRSTQQNRYYHGIVVPLVWDGLRRAGYNITQDEAHEILKSLFNKGQFSDPITGEVTDYGKSTTSLTTSGFMDFIASIQQWAAESIDVIIPDPVSFIDAEVNV